MNLQQPNVPQFNIPKGQEIEPLTSIGAQKMTPDLQGIRNRANQSMQDIAPKSKSPMNMNAVNMGLDIGTQSMSAAANLMGSLGKDNSKAKAFGQGASGAMKVSDSITKPFESIPIAGKAIYIDSEAYTKKLRDYSRFDIKVSMKLNHKKIAQSLFVVVENIFDNSKIAFKPSLLFWPC